MNTWDKYIEKHVRNGTTASVVPKGEEIFKMLPQLRKLVVFTLLLLIECSNILLIRHRYTGMCSSARQSMPLNPTVTPVQRWCGLGALDGVADRKQDFVPNTEAQSISKECHTRFIYMSPDQESKKRTTSLGC